MITAAGFVVCAAAGALARWWATMPRRATRLPWPTLAVNVSGAFALGCLAGSGVSRPVATVVGTGFLGAYTTFSAFTREAHTLAATDDRRAALTYVTLSVTTGVAAAAAGLALS